MITDAVARLMSEDQTWLVLGLFWLFCAVATALIASTRGRNSFLWFALGLVAGPLSFLIVAWTFRAGKGDGNGKRAA